LFSKVSLEPPESETQILIESREGILAMLILLLLSENAG